MYQHEIVIVFCIKKKLKSSGVNFSLFEENIFHIHTMLYSGQRLEMIHELK